MEERKDFLGDRNSVFKSLCRFYLLHWKNLLSIAVGCFLAGPFIIYLAIKFFVPDSLWGEIIGQTGFTITIIPFACLFGIWGYIKTQFIKIFAEENNLKYQARSFDLKSINSQYLRFDDVHVLEDVLSGNHLGYPFRIFTFVSNIGKGFGLTKTGGQVKFTVVEVKRKKEMINLFLKTNYKLLIGSNIIDTEKVSLENNKYPVRLEGNFDDYFKLYMPKGYEIEALQIFTPDVMELFIDKAKQFNAEFIDDTVYFFAQREVIKKIDFIEMYDLVLAFTEKVIPQIEKIKYVKFEDIKSIKI